ncbi:MAG: hypothetical protein LBH18_07805 [Spirochaetaceae bacterium]|jgi:hypothetical protein|nr:hypothetical protein [Spirochaetaceae bacterium]
MKIAIACEKVFSKRTIRRICLRAVPLVFILFFSTCVSQQKVVVGVSGQLAVSYTAYPSIEVDIAAVTDGELAEIKDAGVENYFAPYSGIREKIGAQTMFFSEEQTKPLTLLSRAEIWKSWLEKDPSTLVVIAGLPHDPDMPPPPVPDPRIITVPLKKRLIFASNLYILVEPKKITQVKKAPVNPQINF